VGWQGRNKESLIWAGRKAGGLAGPIRCSIWFLPYLMYISNGLQSRGVKMNWNKPKFAEENLTFAGFMALVGICEMGLAAFIWLLIRLCV